MGVLEWFQDNVVNNNFALSGLEKAQPTPEDARRAAGIGVPIASLAKLPLGVAGGAQFLEQAYDAFGQKSGSVMENFARARYNDPTAFDKIKEHIGQKFDELAAANPGASPEDVAKMTESYKTSPTYNAFERQFIRPTYAWAEDMEDKIDTAFGVPINSQKTNEEMAVQAITQAATPMNFIKLADNAGKIPKLAKFAAEMLLPGNQAVTAPGKAAVAASAGALTAGGNYLFGREVGPEEHMKQMVANQITKDATTLAQDMRHDEQKQATEPQTLPATKYPELNKPDGQDVPTYVDADKRTGALSGLSKILPADVSAAALIAVGAAAGIKQKVNIKAGHSVPDAIPIDTIGSGTRAVRHPAGETPPAPVLATETPGVGPARQVEPTAVPPTAEAPPVRRIPITENAPTPPVEPPVVPPTTPPPTPPTPPAGRVPPAPGMAPYEPGVVRSVGETVNEALDERVPIARAVTQAHGGGREAYAKGVQVSNEIGVHSPSGAGRAKQNQVEHGFIGKEQTIPLKRMDAMDAAMKQTGEEPDVEKFLAARTELNNRNIVISQAENELMKLRMAHDAAVERADVPKARRLAEKMGKIEAERDALLDARPHMKDTTTPELEAIVARGPGGELPQTFVNGHDGVAKAWLKTFENDRLVEPEVVSRLRTAHGDTWAGQIPDPYGGKKGTKRLLAKAVAGLRKVNDPMTQIEERLNPFLHRRLREAAAGTENIPTMRAYDALRLRSNAWHNWRENELYKRGAIEAMLEGRDNAKVLTKFVDDKGRSVFTMEEATKMTYNPKMAARLEEYISVRRFEDNGKISFYKPADPTVFRQLNAGVHASSIWGGAANMLKRGATGIWNVAFTPMSHMLENIGIQWMRPMSSVGYTDLAAYAIGKKVFGKDISHSTISKIGLVTRPLDMFVGQAEVLRVAEVFWKVYRKHIADNMLSAMETDSGWFSAMMKVPAFRDFAATWAKATADNFHQTLEGSLLNGKGLSLGNLTKNLEYARQIDEAYNVAIPQALRMAGAPFSEFVAAGKTFISAWRDVAKWSHYQRQMVYYSMKHGGEANIPASIKNSILTEVRTVTGDFSKRMGNSKLRAFDDAIPYFRVMIQATKNAAQRVVADPKLAAAVMTGAIMPKIYFEYQMANWDKGARDWYYRQNSDYERAAFIGFIRPDIWIRLMKGEQVPFSPDYVWKLYSPQEWRPMIEAVSQGVRALGAYRANQKDRVAGTTVGGQIGEALSQAIAPSLPPPLASILAAGGVRVSIGNAVIPGKSMIEPNRNPDRLNEQLAGGDNLSKGTYETIKALTGTVGGVLMQGYATGKHIYDKDNSLADAVFGGAKEVVQRSTTPRAMPIPWVGDANNRRYRQTAVSNELYKMKGAFDQVTGPYSSKIAKVEDPIIGTIVDYLKSESKSFEGKDFKAQYKEISTKITEIENNRSIPYWQRQDMQKGELKKLHNLNVKQNEWMLRVQKEIAGAELEPGITVGQAYEKQFGAPFSLTHFADTAKKTKAKLGR